MEDEDNKKPVARPKTAMPKKEQQPAKQVDPVVNKSSDKLMKKDESDSDVSV